MPSASLSLNDQTHATFSHPPLSSLSFSSSSLSSCSFFSFSYSLSSSFSVFSLIHGQLVDGDNPTMEVLLPVFLFLPISLSLLPLSPLSLWRSLILRMVYLWPTSRPSFQYYLLSILNTHFSKKFSFLYMTCYILWQRHSCRCHPIFKHKRSYRSTDGPLTTASRYATRIDV